MPLRYTTEDMSGCQDRTGHSKSNASYSIRFVKITSRFVFYALNYSSGT